MRGLKGEIHAKRDLLYVLFVIERFSHARAVQQFADLVPELTRRGHQMDVVALFREPREHQIGDAAQSFVQSGAGVFRLDLRQQPLGPEALARLVRGRGYDVVHACLPSPMLIPALAVRRARGPARVIYLYEPCPVGQRRRRRALSIAKSRLIARHQDTVVTTSRIQAQRYATQLGRSSVSVVPHIVAANTLRPEPSDRVEILAPFGIDPEETVLLVPNGAPAGGQQPTLEALVRLRCRGFRPRLILSCPRIARASVQDQIVRMGLATQVSIRPDEGSRAQLHDLIRVSDITVLPSSCRVLTDTIGEAMALEAPILAAAEGDLLDLVEDGVNGALFPDGDPDALAHALQTLLESPERRARFGLTARQRVLHERTAPIIASRWEEIYRQALTHHRSVRPSS